jgi:hypothetical protein
MYTLIFVSNFLFLGTYADLYSCQNAISEIYTQKANPPGMRLPELEEGINITIKTQKQLLCIPVKKSKD